MSKHRQSTSSLSTAFSFLCCCEPRVGASNTEAPPEKPTQFVGEFLLHQQGPANNDNASEKEGLFIGHPVEWPPTPRTHPLTSLALHLCDESNDTLQALRTASAHPAAFRNLWVHEHQRLCRQSLPKFLLLLVSYGCSIPTRNGSKRNVALRPALRRFWPRLMDAFYSRRLISLWIWAVFAHSCFLSTRKNCAVSLPS